LGAFANMRYFRLSDGGVQCGHEGLSVGSAPMLSRSLQADGVEVWVVRPTEELDHDLSARYGHAIDLTSKRGGLEGVARALQRGDMTLAKIGAVLLGFPDPPSLAKDTSARGSLALAAQLFWSGLLKGDWDPSKHHERASRPISASSRPKTRPICPR
jgi:hypothetical protein